MYICTTCTYNIFCKINKTLHYMAGPIWTFGFLNRTLIHGPFKGLLYVQRVYSDFRVGSFVKREDIFNPMSMLKFNAILLEGSRYRNYGAQIRQAKKNTLRIQQFKLNWLFISRVFMNLYLYTSWTSLNYKFTSLNKALFGLRPLANGVLIKYFTGQNISNNLLFDTYLQGYNW